jgi:hypothetical protein
MKLTQHEWQTAQDVCTSDQLRALDYWRSGCGYKRIAVALEISRDAARGRVERGLSNIQRARYTHGREAA